MGTLQTCRSSKRLLRGLVEPRAFGADQEAGLVHLVAAGDAHDDAAVRRGRTHGESQRRTAGDRGARRLVAQLHQPAARGGGGKSEQGKHDAGEARSASPIAIGLRSCLEGLNRTVHRVPRVRLDSLLAERGLFESRTCVAAAVIAGPGPSRPRHGGGRRSRASSSIPPSSSRSTGPPPYVSRGGVKLANALDALQVPRSPGGTRWTWERRPAASRTACCSAARSTSSRSTSPTASSTARLRDGPARDRDRAHQRPRARPPTTCPYRPDLVVVDVSFISLTQGPAGRAAAPAPATLRLPGAGQAAVRGRARADRQGRRRARSGAAPRGRQRRRGGRPRGRRGGHGQRARRRSRARPGNKETFLWLAEGARPERSTEVEAW